MEYGCSIRVSMPAKNVYIIGLGHDVHESMTYVRPYTKERAYIEFRRLLGTMKREDT